jgi:hypothetical protein
MGQGLRSWQDIMPELCVGGIPKPSPVAPPRNVAPQIAAALPPSFGQSSQSSFAGNFLGNGDIGAAEIKGSSLTVTPSSTQAPAYYTIPWRSLAGIAANPVQIAIR